jgi:anti-sigma regulatory factor (Ser/Thr protein kinase)
VTELLLMTPGPTRAPERVLRAGGRPMIHHRTPEFARELATVLDLLAPIFGTTQPILPVHTTGRGALEATVCNLFSAGDEVVVCCNGKFGEMWAGFAESYGVVTHRIETSWERSVNPAAVEAFVVAHPRVKAVAMTSADSSTGVASDVAAVARCGRRPSSQPSAKDLRLVVECGENSVVRTDAGVLSLVLQNLVGNAIKYSQQGAIYLRCTHDPANRVTRRVISVIDEGPGIAPDHVAHIFEAFRRGEAHGREGVGLGLAIAPQAAKALGAELTVESTLGKGPSFHLRLQPD